MNSVAPRCTPPVACNGLTRSGGAGVCLLGRRRRPLASSASSVSDSAGSSRPKEEHMDNRDRTDQTGHAPEGAGPQKPLTHTDSGNSGGSKTTHGGPGTAGSVEQATPGAPKPSK